MKNETQNNRDTTSDYCIACQGINRERTRRNFLNNRHAIDNVTAPAKMVMPTPHNHEYSNSRGQI